MAYGHELILDLVECDTSPFTRQAIELYLATLCNLLNVKREELHWWDYEGQPDEYVAAEPHMKGISAVQFISKSSVVIHTLDDLRMVFLDIFSCGDFDAGAVTRLSAKYFGGKVGAAVSLERGVAWSA